MTQADRTSDRGTGSIGRTWGGELPPEWSAAVGATPREVFVPDRAWRVPRSGPAMSIDRHADPRAWMEAVSSADVLVTQLDDGLEHGPGKYTSSCPMPQVMGAMLGHLDVHEGHRVLEIGTGTGWNAAILAARLALGGADQARRHHPHPVGPTVR